jgi:fibronectin type 3 domain-containing protein
MRIWLRGWLITFLIGVLMGCGGGSSSPGETVALPAIPSSLSVEPGDTFNTVQWPAVVGATSYNLYWSDATPVTKQSTHVVKSAVSPYKHTSLTNGVLLYYAVSAVNAAGESDLSTEIGAMPVAAVPAAPDVVHATPGDQQVTVDWAPVSGAVTYNLYWSNTATPVPGASGVTKIAALTATSYSHTGLTNGTTYKYVVTAVNAGGESVPSMVASVVPLPPAPSAPASLKATSGDTLVNLDWSTSLGATAYNLYWSTTAGVVPGATGVTKIAGLTGAIYAHTGLTNGTTYHYVLTAVGLGGESGPSSEAMAKPLPPAPGAPANLAATAGDTLVNLAWSPSLGATSYTLFWAAAPGVVPGAAGVTAITGIAGTTYLHSALTNGQTYYYVVRAENIGGPSAPSAEVSARPLPPVPGAPTNIAATTGDTQVHLAWSAPALATSYNVYWSKTAGVVPGAAGVTQIGGVAATSYLHTGLTNGDTYHYVVSANGAGGESLPSTEVSARPLPPPPPAPQGLTAIAPKDSSTVTVQWFDVTNYPSASAPIQVGYNLYRGLQPGLATYYKDSSRATKIANVTAPFLDATLTKATTYYYVVTSFVPSLPDVESVPSGEVSATTGRGGSSGGSGGSTGGDTGFGNNLSFPVIFADGYGITGAKITGAWPGVGPFTPAPSFDYNTGIRPLSTETLTTFPYYDSSTAVSLAGVVYYPQATASTWEAEWRNNASGNLLEVIVDWGDALLSKSYTTSSMVRIETVLKQDATITGVTDTMTAYKMALLSGSQTTESQGTDGTTYASAVRNVFAINARLKIEKIATGGGADTVVYDKAIYEGFGTTTTEGSGSGGGTSSSSYAAELNVGGSLVYGYNFRLNQVTGIPDKRGDYRITFSLDPKATLGSVQVDNHVKMVNKLDAGATLSADGLSSSVVITVQ